MLQVREAHTLERLADTHVDPLPCHPDTAERFETTTTVHGAALRDCYGAFERVDDLGGADRIRSAGEGVAALHSTRRDHEARMHERLQELADGWLTEVCRVRDLARGRQA